MNRRRKTNGKIYHNLNHKILSAKNKKKKLMKSGFKISKQEVMDYSDSFSRKQKFDSMWKDGNSYLTYSEELK